MSSQHRVTVFLDSWRALIEDNIYGLFLKSKNKESAAPKKGLFYHLSIVEGLMVLNYGVSPPERCFGSCPSFWGRPSGQLPELAFVVSVVRYMNSWKYEKCRSTLPFCGKEMVDWKITGTHFEYGILKKSSSIPYGSGTFLVSYLIQLPHLFYCLLLVEVNWRDN